MSSTNFRAYLFHPFLVTFTDNIISKQSLDAENGQKPLERVQLPNVDKLGLPSVQSLSFEWKTVDVEGGGPEQTAFPASCVVGSKIYFFDYANPKTRKGIIFRVLNTDTNCWEADIVPKTDPGLQHPSGAWRVVNDLIAVLAGDNWFFFDLKTMDWSDRTITCSEYPQWGVSASSDRISARSQDAFVWDGRDTMIRVNLTSGENKTVKSQWGEVPYDRSGTEFAIGDCVLCFAPDPYSKKSQPSLFVHDPAGGKWRSLPTDNEDLRNDSQCVGYIVTRVGHFVLILSAQWGNPYHLTVCDLARREWVDLPPMEGAPIHDSNCRPTLVGNRIFLWGPSKEIKLHILTINQLIPSVEIASKFDVAFSDDFKSIFSKMEPPVEAIDEFVESNVLEERDIVTNDQLAPCDWKNMKFHREIEQSLQGLFRKSPIVAPTFLRHNLPAAAAGPDEGKPRERFIFHKNMITYLTIAYDGHFSVILTPDMIFYTLLCELADEIKGKPEKFEALFTSTPGQKQKIITLSEDIESLDLNQIVEELKKRIPGGNSEMLTAKFSTSDADSLLALNAAFADAMSPYYDYFSTCCGIPRVRVLGTKEDWQRIEAKLGCWLDKFGSPLKVWLNAAIACVRDIYTKRDPLFWKEMFSVNRCSSGHTDVAEGWITRLYRCGYASKYKGAVTYGSNDFYNFESHISTVKWEQMETGGKYGLYTGLLYSEIQIAPDSSSLDTKFPFLEPHFAHLIRDENPQSLSEEAYEQYVESLPNDDAVFLTSYREFMDNPIVFGSSQEKIRQKQQLVLAKYKKMKLWAESGDARALSLRFDYSFASDINHSSWGNDKKETPADPIIRQIAEAIRDVFAVGKTVSELYFSPSCGLGDYWDIIFEGLHNHPTVRKIELDSNSSGSGQSPFFDSFDSPFCKLLRSDPLALESISIRFGYEKTDFSFLARAISETSAPLRVFEGFSVPLPIARALCDRTAHKSHPMKVFNIRSTAYSEEEPWAIPDTVMNRLVNQVSLEHLDQFELNLFAWTREIFQDSKRPAAEVEAAKVRVRELAMLYVRFLQNATNLHYHSPNLTEVDEEADRQILAAICELPLRSLTVHNRGLSSDIAAKVVVSLKDLRKINAIGTGFGDPFCVAVGRALERPDCQIDEVYLSKNPITHEGATAIFIGALRNTANRRSLNVLQLYRCKIGSGAVESLAQLLRSESCSLRVLHIGANPLSAQDVTQIVSALAENKSLTEIKLESIRLGADEVPVLKALSDALKTNKTLKSIIISCHNAKKSDLDQFASDISENTTLTSFSIERWGGGLLDEIYSILNRNRALTKEHLLSSSFM